MTVATEFGDLDIEANRIRFIEAMILDRIIPPLNGQGHRLEVAFMGLPSDTMRKVLETMTKLHEVHRKQACFILDEMQYHYLLKGEA